MARWLVAILLVVAALGGPRIETRAQTPVEVDVALVLAVDISYSMDLDELALQRRGYVEAFRSKVIHDAIARGALGKIAVTYFEWAGAGIQYQIAPWTIIDSPALAQNFAAVLEDAPLRRGRRTSISAAIDNSVKLLETSGVEALRQVMDISGDGPNNDGRPVTLARDQALAKGIRINGLPVMLKRPGYMDIEDLDVYYEECVIGGQGSFLLTIREREQFSEAVRTKLVMEIADLKLDETPLIRKAQARAPRINCSVGERQWRDRMGN
jgi:Protein of unknown function (DUF1194)